MALEKEEGLHTQTREAAATRESALTAKATEASAAAETAQVQLAALRESSESERSPSPAVDADGSADATAEPASRFGTAAVLRRDGEKSADHGPY